MAELIHPGLLVNLRNFFASQCTIRQSTVTQDSIGGESHNWADLAGHTNIPCTIAPSGGREVKRSDMAYVIATHHVTLAGHYPQVQETMKAVVDGLELEIALVEHDSHQVTTRLACVLVE